MKNSIIDNISEGILFNNRIEKQTISDLEDKYDRKYNAFCLTISTYDKDKLENILSKKETELKSVQSELKSLKSKDDKLEAKIKIDYLKNVCDKCKSKLKKIK